MGMVCHVQYGEHPKALVGWVVKLDLAKDLTHVFLGIDESV